MPLLPAIAIAGLRGCRGGVGSSGSLLELLSSQYVRTLHAKAVETRILWLHGLKKSAFNLFPHHQPAVNRMLRPLFDRAVFAIPGGKPESCAAPYRAISPDRTGVCFAIVIVG